MYENGKLPDAALSKIPGGRLAKGAPARSWLAMRQYIGHRHNVWLRPTGPVSSYRGIDAQRRFYVEYTQGRGALAAVPGKSNHGLGLAVDIPTSTMQKYVREYGHLFGWGIRGGVLSSDAPSEAWHVTYRGPYTPFARRWYWRRRLALRKGK